MNAIDAGYRHIDCAWRYGNERDVGEAVEQKISEGVISRGDMFITTKLWCNFHEKNKVVPLLKDSLKNLKMNYVDLFLIHWPFGFKEEAPSWPKNKGKSAYSDVDITDTWQGMEKAYDLGLARNIGVSNFNKSQIEKLLLVSRTRPVCNQVEVNPNFNNKRLIAYCKSFDIVVVGYCPLGRIESFGRPGVPKPTMLDPKIMKMAKKYNKTSAQVVLNYLVNNLGVAVIPKSITKSRIIENFNIFDFQLEQKDIDYIESTNKNARVCLASYFGDHKDYPFHDEF
ncbi:hypothetical protein WA026_009406 [Henosepilachna vigintioctopunctata]|uniref:NADP-dependent oxidoreductase domain-containing protein n=1 Tax=Henosepilachna vigintioctopunctata TaxID=420089 RepID=A0AAW1TVL3_9CUCU